MIVAAPVQARAPQDPARTRRPPPLPTRPPSAEHPDLARWAENVGAPLSLDWARPLPRGEVQGIDVLCWNLFIGAARLDQLFGLLRGGAWGGAGTDPRRPLVILAQEAYRSDASVPVRPLTRFFDAGVEPEGRTGIAETAAAHALSVRYAPSMRLGMAPRDKGNAILSTAALGPMQTVVLPFVRQRRVVVGAELAGLPGLMLVSGHLDTRGAQRALGFWRGAISPFGEGRATQARVMAAHFIEAAGQAGSVIIGADLNAPLGARDPAHRELVRAGFTPAKRIGPFGHTFHVPVRFPLDFVLYHSPTQRIRSVEVVRLDEEPEDRSRYVFGSDHHPLLARVSLAPAHVP